MNNDNKIRLTTTLPSYACLPVNRCNLPPQILGSLTFQRHPVFLEIDGVKILHKRLFAMLEELDDQSQRARRFMDYMVVQFRLHHLEEAGLEPDEQRGKADYLRLLRGWMFNPDGREAAVIKGWVESRFGLLPRYHNGKLHHPEDQTYLCYLAARAEGLYGANALEAQLDLLYSYCQYELSKRYQPHQRLTLFRGVNRLEDYDLLTQEKTQQTVVLLNNINACTSCRERADEFGDLVMEVPAPWQKILFYSHLLPHHVGEDEFLLIGGAYEVKLHYW